MLNWASTYFLCDVSFMYIDASHHHIGYMVCKEMRCGMVRVHHILATVKKRKWNKGLNMWLVRTERYVHNNFVIIIVVQLYILILHLSYFTESV